MKKIIFISAMCLFFIFEINAQPKDSLSSSKKELKIEAGLIFNPQASMSLKEHKKLFEESYPLYAGAFFTKNNFIVLPFFSFENSIGTFLIYSLPDIEFYVMGMKSIVSKEDYCAFGIDIPVFDRKANIFLEIGKFLDKSDPILCSGISIPFTKKIK